MRQRAIEPLQGPELFLHCRNDCGQSLRDGRRIRNSALRHVSLPAPSTPGGFGNLLENAIRSQSPLAQIISHHAKQALLSVYLRREHRDPAAQTVANGVGESAESPGVGRRYTFGDDPYSLYVSCFFGETLDFTTPAASHRLIHAFLERALLLDE